MDIVTGITGLAAAGSALFNLLKDLKGIESNPTFDSMTEQVVGLNSRIIDVQSAALELQGQNADLSKQVADLETQLAKMKDWDAEKQRYELRAIGDTAFVYALKPDVETTEPPHWLCCGCYEANHKSFLVVGTLRAERGYIPWKCSQCNFYVMVSWNDKPT